MGHYESEMRASGYAIIPEGNSPGQYEETDASSSARIGSQLGYMNDQLQKTQAVFSELSSRLEQILIPEQETAAKMIDGVPRKPSSELSNTIDDLNSQISRLQRRIISVLERVQL